MRKLTYLLAVLLFSVNSYASEPHDENEIESFPVSEKAVSTFGLKLQSLATGGGLNLPASALVFIKNETFLYRFRDSKYQRVKLDKFSRNEGSVFVQSSELKAGDQIVIHGVNFLRTYEISLTAEMDHH